MRLASVATLAVWCSVAFVPSVAKADSTFVVTVAAAGRPAFGPDYDERVSYNNGSTEVTSQLLTSPFGQGVVSSLRGRVSATCSTAPDAGWRRTSMFADAQWFEQVVVTVPCRPDLNQQPGFIKLRRPTAIVSGNSSGASGIPGGDVDHNSYRLVYMNFNTLRVFTKEVQSGSEEGNPPVDFFNDGLLPITFGAPFMIHLGASADSRTVLYSEGSSASASSAAVAIWEGIEAAYDQNGVQIPCLGCLAFPCPTCDVVEVCSPFVPPPACPGDTNNDGATDAADLSVLLATFGSQVAPYSGADYNGDAQVTGADLSVLLSNFGCDVTP